MINIVINKINTQKYFLFFKQNIILPTININLLSVITFNINKYIQSITLKKRKISLNYLDFGEVEDSYFTG